MICGGTMDGDAIPIDIGERTCYIIYSKARGAEHERKVAEAMMKKYSSVIGGVIGGMVGLSVAITIIATQLSKLHISVEPLPIAIGVIGYTALLFVISDRMTAAGVSLKRRIRERLQH